MSSQSTAAHLNLTPSASASFSSPKSYTPRSTLKVHRKSKSFSSHIPRHHSSKGVGHQRTRFVKPADFSLLIMGWQKPSSSKSEQLTRRAQTELHLAGLIDAIRMTERRLSEQRVSLDLSKSRSNDQKLPSPTERRASVVFGKFPERQHTFSNASSATVFSRGREVSADVTSTIGSRSPTNFSVASEVSTVDSVQSPSHNVAFQLPTSINKTDEKTTAKLIEPLSELDSEDGSKANHHQINETANSPVDKELPKMSRRHTDGVFEGNKHSQLGSRNEKARFSGFGWIQKQASTEELSDAPLSPLRSRFSVDFRNILPRRSTEGGRSEFAEDHSQRFPRKSMSENRHSVADVNDLIKSESTDTDGKKKPWQRIGRLFKNPLNIKTSNLGQTPQQHSPASPADSRRMNNVQAMSPVDGLRKRMSMFASHPKRADSPTTPREITFGNVIPRREFTQHALSSRESLLEDPKASRVSLVSNVSGSKVVSTPQIRPISLIVGSSSSGLKNNVPPSPLRSTADMSRQVSRQSNRSIRPKFEYNQPSSSERRTSTDIGSRFPRPNQLRLLKNFLRPENQRNDLLPFRGTLYAFDALALDAGNRSMSLPGRSVNPLKVLTQESILANSKPLMCDSSTQTDENTENAAQTTETYEQTKITNTKLTNVPEIDTDLTTTTSSHSSAQQLPVTANRVLSIENEKRISSMDSANGITSKSTDEVEPPVITLPMEEKTEARNNDMDIIQNTESIVDTMKTTETTVAKVNSKSFATRGNIMRVLRKLRHPRRIITGKAINSIEAGETTASLSRRNKRSLSRKRSHSSIRKDAELTKIVAALSRQGSISSCHNEIVESEVSSPEHDGEVFENQLEDYAKRSMARDSGYGSNSNFHGGSSPTSVMRYLADCVENYTVEVKGSDRASIKTHISETVVIRDDHDDDELVEMVVKVDDDEKSLKKTVPPSVIKTREYIYPETRSAISEFACEHERQMLSIPEEQESADEDEKPRNLFKNEVSFEPKVTEIEYEALTGSDDDCNEEEYDVDNFAGYSRPYSRSSQFSFSSFGSEDAAYQIFEKDIRAVWCQDSKPTRRCSSASVVTMPVIVEDAEFEFEDTSAHAIGSKDNTFDSDMEKSDICTSPELPRLDIFKHIQDRLFVESAPSPGLTEISDDWHSAVSNFDSERRSSMAASMISKFTESKVDEFYESPFEIQGETSENESIELELKPVGTCDLSTQELDSISYNSDQVDLDKSLVFISSEETFAKSEDIKESGVDAFGVNIEDAVEVTLPKIEVVDLEKGGETTETDSEVELKEDGDLSKPLLDIEVKEVTSPRSPYFKNVLDIVSERSNSTDTVIVPTFFASTCTKRFIPAIQTEIENEALLDDGFVESPVSTKLEHLPLPKDDETSAEDCVLTPRAERTIKDFEESVEDDSAVSTVIVAELRKIGSSEDWPEFPTPPATLSEKPATPKPKREPRQILTPLVLGEPYYEEEEDEQTPHIPETPHPYAIADYQFPSPTPHDADLTEEYIVQEDSKPEVYYTNGGPMNFVEVGSESRQLHKQPSLVIHKFADEDDEETPIDSVIFEPFANQDSLWSLSHKLIPPLPAGFGSRRSSRIRTYSENPAKSETNQPSSPSADSFKTFTFPGKSPLRDFVTAQLAEAADPWAVHSPQRRWSDPMNDVDAIPEDEIELRVVRKPSVEQKLAVPEFIHQFDDLSDQQVDFIHSSNAILDLRYGPEQYEEATQYSRDDSSIYVDSETQESLIDYNAENFHGDLFPANENAAWKPLVIHGNWADVEDSPLMTPEPIDVISDTYSFLNTSQENAPSYPKEVAPRKLLAALAIEAERIQSSMPPADISASSAPTPVQKEVAAAVPAPATTSKRSRRRNNKSNNFDKAQIEVSQQPQPRKRNEESPPVKLENNNNSKRENARNRKKKETSKHEVVCLKETTKSTESLKSETPATLPSQNKKHLNVDAAPWGGFNGDNQSMHSNSNHSHNQQQDNNRFISHQRNKSYGRNNNRNKVEDQSRSKQNNFTQSSSTRAPVPPRQSSHVQSYSTSSVENFVETNAAAMAFNYFDSDKKGVAAVKPKWQPRIYSKGSPFGGDTRWDVDTIIKQDQILQEQRLEMEKQMKIGSLEGKRYNGSRKQY